MGDPSSHPDVFGRALRRLRRERDLSQEALARAAGITPKHMSELERGRSDPRLSTLVRIADALGLRSGELLARFDQQRERPSDA